MVGIGAGYGLRAHKCVNSVMMHVQIINLIIRRGEKSVINPVNKIRGVSIY